MPKQKQIKYDYIEPDAGPEERQMYDLLLDLIASHHTHLDEAVFALVWRRDLKPDPDGQLVLGKCRKRSDMDRELPTQRKEKPIDFVILLNKEAWQELNPEQREALLYHELCHAQVARDKDGKIKRDSRGRPVWRIKKHDIEEFAGVVERYGCYKLDLQRFVEAALKKKSLPLFTGDGSDDDQDHEEKKGRKAPKRA